MKRKYASSLVLLITVVCLCVPIMQTISAPLVTLTRKDSPFHWTDAHTQVVRQLKQRLIDYTTLEVPDTSKPFELYTDASGDAIGGVLEQDGQPTGFLSQVMRSALALQWSFGVAFIGLKSCKATNIVEYFGD